MYKKNKKIQDLTNKELGKLLCAVNYCDVDLMKEYDERKRDGRIKFGEPVPQEKIQEFIHKKYSARRNKKAS